MSNNNLESLHKLELSVLKQINDFFDENNLIYFAIGGTFLGAVRHKGFIPWDDDIDIAMPRESYNRLIKLSKDTDIFDEALVVNFHNQENARTYFTQIVVKDDYLVKYGLKENRIEGLALVDILPIDGYPDNHLMQTIYKFRIYVNKAFAALSNSDKREINKVDSFRTLIYSIANKLKIYKMFNRKKYYQKLDKIYSLNLNKETKLSGTVTGAYMFKELVESSFWKTREKYKFEDTFIYGGKDFDKYLTHIYGQYMILPPEEQRKSIHEVIE